MPVLKRRRRAATRAAWAAAGVAVTPSGPSVICLSTRASCRSTYRQARSFASLRPDNPVTEAGVLAELSADGTSRRGRSDRRRHVLEPVVVAGPWVAAAGVALLGGWCGGPAADSSPPRPETTKAPHLRGFLESG